MSKKSIIGKTFGMLTVVNKTDKRTPKKDIYYDCVCECGKHRLVIMQNLKRGSVTRCISCSSKQRSKQIEENIFSKGQKLTVEGTNLSIISKKRQNSNNTSGYKGVTYNKVKRKWCAQIVFKKKHHYLGCFTDINDAVNARLEAEERLFDPILLKYKNEVSKLKKSND